MGVGTKSSAILNLVRFPHTAFALPFALAGAFLAARGWPTAWQIGWILVAMVAARTGAMSLNRYADAELDALNPRTREWPIQLGLVTKGQAMALTVISWAVFVIVGYMLRPWLALLAPPAIFVFAIYPYTKRFTWTSHFILGLALGMAPVGAWLAIVGRLDWAPVSLMVAIIFWVAGFDILYSLEDLDFDVGQGLKSIPQRFGIGAAFLMARVCHGVAVGTLLLPYLLLGLGVIYLFGVGVAGGLILFEHLFLRGEDPRRVEGAFFTVNGFVSVAVMLFTLADIFIKV